MEKIEIDPNLTERENFTRVFEESLIYVTKKMIQAVEQRKPKHVQGNWEELHEMIVDLIEFVEMEDL